jgi:hypothetical protein
MNAHVSASDFQSSAHLAAGMTSRARRPSTHLSVG